MSRKTLHPTFQNKQVLCLECRACGNCVCTRGMRAILLANTQVELYSTDIPPEEAVDLVGDHYATNNCQCRIKDVACLQCGSLVGYHVMSPCKSCLLSCNNGHFWMYHSHAVSTVNRARNSRKGVQLMVWKHLPEAEVDPTLAATSVSSLEIETDECCR
ncbi:PREDICTED: protein FAM72A-like [Priapulus caudatus]|uniref:Protein FAM72A-like n=1 Tax=Priapulus caudatus TaxID=37621 RepID=A0ABM1EWQ4_PRICU|nr:PREDICTED: protein FAM72A-like [Priapulus caudatus]